MHRRIGHPPRHTARTRARLLLDVTARFFAATLGAFSGAAAFVTLLTLLADLLGAQTC